MPSATEKLGPRYAKVPARAVGDQRLGKGDINVLCALGIYVDRDGYCWPGVETLAARLNVSGRYVTGCLRKLERFGYVERSPRFDEAGRQTTSMYCIIFDDACAPNSSSTTPREDEPEVHPGVPTEFTGRVNTDTIPGGEHGVHPNDSQERPRGLRLMAKPPPQCLRAV